MGRRGAGGPARRAAGPVAARHAAARREFRILGGAPRTALPAWRIVAPAPLADLQAFYQQAGAEFGIPWPYLAAINLVETATDASGAPPRPEPRARCSSFRPPGRPTAAGATSTTHATRSSGPPAPAANGAAIDLPGALYHYNHSDHYVQGVTATPSSSTSTRSAAGAVPLGRVLPAVNGDVYLPVGYGVLRVRSADG